MSHSVPSDSSATDPIFIVGTELVEFDRRELPIFQTPDARLSDTRWEAACFDEAPYGAPLDRLFGEPGDVHLDSVAGDAPQALIAAYGDDPLVALASLSDGVLLPGSEPSLVETFVASHPVFDFTTDLHAVAPPHDGWNAGWSWDSASVDWTFDFHA